MKTIILEFGVSLYDARGISEEDRDVAENAFREKITELVPSAELLKLIRNDDISGMQAGVEHFEKTDSAWKFVNGETTRYAFDLLGFWPAEAAHFEITFGRD